MQLNRSVCLLCVSLCAAWQIRSVGPATAFNGARVRFASPTLRRVRFRRQLQGRQLGALPETEVADVVGLLALEREAAGALAH